MFLVSRCGPGAGPGIGSRSLSRTARAIRLNTCAPFPVAWTADDRGSAGRRSAGPVWHRGHRGLSGRRQGPRRGARRAAARLPGAGGRGAAPRPAAPDHHRRGPRPAGEAARATGRPGGARRTGNGLHRPARSPPAAQRGRHADAVQQRAGALRAPLRRPAVRVGGRELRAARDRVRADRHGERRRDGRVRGQVPRRDRDRGGSGVRRIPRHAGRRRRDGIGGLHSPAR